MRYFITYTIFVIIVFTFPDCNKYKELTINDIKIYYKKVNDNIKSGNLLSMKYINKNINDNESIMYSGSHTLSDIAECYYDPKTKLLIKVCEYYKTCQILIYKEYVYYSNGNLIFHYEKGTNHSGFMLLSESRYYFSNNKLIYLILNEPEDMFSIPPKDELKIRHYTNPPKLQNEFAQSILKKALKYKNNFTKGMNIFN